MIPGLLKSQSNDKLTVGQTILGVLVLWVTNGTRRI